MAEFTELSPREAKALRALRLLQAQQRLQATARSTQLARVRVARVVNRMHGFDKKADLKRQAGLAAREARALEKLALIHDALSGCSRAIARALRTLQPVPRK